MSSKFWLKIVCPRCKAAVNEACTGVAKPEVYEAHADRLKAFRLRANRNKVWMQSQGEAITYSQFSQWAWDREPSTSHRNLCQAMGLEVTQGVGSKAYMVRKSQALAWLDMMELGGVAEPSTPKPNSTPLVDKMLARLAQKAVAS